MSTNGSPGVNDFVGYQIRNQMVSVRAIGEYTLERNPLNLYKGVHPIKATARQLQALSVLVEAEGNVVSRDTLLNKVWNDTIVEEHNVTQTIFMLRRLLGRMPDGTAYIETVPRRGYRISPIAFVQTPPFDRSHELLDSPVSPMKTSRLKKIVEGFRVVLRQSLFV